MTHEHPDEAVAEEQGSETTFEAHHDYVPDREKQTKFRDQARPRVQGTLDRMDLLETMARSTTYDYAAQDARRIFETLRGKLDEVERTFDEELRRRATKSDRGKDAFVF